ncbi:MAG: hypothetical protein ACN6OP_27205 [Pseudomonadales bacterium]
MTNIYCGVDAVGKGQLFWTAFTQRQPLPFELEGHSGAVLNDPATDRTLVLAVAESPRDDERLLVQLLVSENVELEVSLTQDHHEFICGTHLGRAVDEVSAVDVLTLHLPIVGQWLHLMDEDASLVGEESEHG